MVPQEQCCQRSSRPPCGVVAGFTCLPASRLSARASEQNVEQPATADGRARSNGYLATSTDVPELKMVVSALFALLAASDTTLTLGVRHRAPQRCRPQQLQHHRRQLRRRAYQRRSLTSFVRMSRMGPAHPKISCSFSARVADYARYGDCPGACIPAFA